jgi:hypothetical protein
VTAGWRAQHSHALYFNPRDPASARFNPLAEIRPGPQELAQVQRLVAILSDPGGARDDEAIWDKAASEILEAVILHVLYTAEDDAKSLVTVRGLLADLDDVAGLLEADRDGLLRAAATAGARVRATAAAVEEGALESVTGGQRPRTLIWVSGRGTAEAAGAMLAALLGGSAGEPVVLAAEAPTWVGPLDAVVVAGDDAGDPALVTAAATAVRRGARVVVAAPFEGPLRDATAGRAAVLAPRMWVPDDFGLVGHLAAGLAAAAAVDPSVGADLGRLADELDAEALRNSAGRELFTNPA